MSGPTSQGSSGTYMEPTHKKEPLSSAETSRKPVLRKASQGSAGTSWKPVYHNASLGFAGISKIPFGKRESCSSSQMSRKSMIDPISMRKYESHYYKNLWKNKNNYTIKRPRLDTHLMRQGYSKANDEIRTARTKDYISDLKKLKENIYKMDLAAKERINRLHKIANVNRLLSTKDGMMDYGTPLNTKKGLFIGSTNVPYSYCSANVMSNERLSSGRLSTSFLESTSLPRKWRHSIDIGPKYRGSHSSAPRGSNHLRSPHTHQPENLSGMLGTDKYKSYTRALTSCMKYSPSPLPQPVARSTLQMDKFRRVSKGYDSKSSPSSTKYMHPSDKKDKHKILNTTVARRWASFGGASSEDDGHSVVSKSKGQKQMIPRDSCILYDGKKIRWARINSINSVSYGSAGDDEVGLQSKKPDGSEIPVTAGKKSVKVFSTKKRMNDSQIEADHIVEEKGASIPGASEIMKMNKMEQIMLLKRLVAVPPHKVIATLNHLRMELDKLDLDKYQVMELSKLEGKFREREETAPGSSKYKPVHGSLPAGVFESSPAIATLAKHVVEDFVFDRNLTTSTMANQVTGPSSHLRTHEPSSYLIEEGRHSLHSSISSSKPDLEFPTHQGTAKLSDSSLGTTSSESDSNKDMRRPSTASCHFAKVLGEVYHMYLRDDGSTYLSMLSPAERGKSSYMAYIGSYRQNEDGKMSHVASPSSLSLIRTEEIGMELLSHSGSSLVNTTCTAGSVPGYNYYKYEKNDGTTFLTTCSPSLWGSSCPHKFIKAYRQNKSGGMVPIRTSSTSIFQHITTEHEVDSGMKETEITTSLSGKQEEQESNIKSDSGSDFHLDLKPNTPPVLTPSSSDFELSRVTEEEENKDRTETPNMAREDSEFFRETEEKYSQDHGETPDMAGKYSVFLEEDSVSDHETKEWQSQGSLTNIIQPLGTDSLNIALANEEIDGTLYSVSSIMESTISKESKEDSEMAKIKDLLSMNEAAIANLQSNDQNQENESISLHTEDGKRSEIVVNIKEIDVTGAPYTDTEWDNDLPTETDESLHYWKERGKISVPVETLSLENELDESQDVNTTVDKNASLVIADQDNEKEEVTSENEVEVDVPHPIYVKSVADYHNSDEANGQCMKSLDEVVSPGAKISALEEKEKSSSISSSHISTASKNTEIPDISLSQHSIEKKQSNIEYGAELKREDDIYPSRPIEEEPANLHGDSIKIGHKAVTVVDIADEKDVQKEFESMLLKTPTYLHKGENDKSNSKSSPYIASEQEMSNLLEDRTEAVENDIIFPGALQSEESRNTLEDQGNTKIGHESISDTLFKSEVSDHVHEMGEHNGMPPKAKETAGPLKHEVDVEKGRKATPVELENVSKIQIFEKEKSSIFDPDGVDTGENLVTIFKTPSNSEEIKQDSATLVMMTMEKETSSQLKEKLKEINGLSQESELDKDIQRNGNYRADDDMPFSSSMTDSWDNDKDNGIADEVMLTEKAEIEHEVKGKDNVYNDDDQVSAEEMKVLSNEPDEKPVFTSAMNVEEDYQYPRSSDLPKNSSETSAKEMREHMQTEMTGLRDTHSNHLSEWQGELLPSDHDKEGDNSWDMSSRTDDKATNNEPMS